MTGETYLSRVQQISIFCRFLSPTACSISLLSEAQQRAAVAGSLGLCEFSTLRKINCVRTVCRTYRLLWVSSSLEIVC